MGWIDIKHHINVSVRRSQSEFFVTFILYNKYYINYCFIIQIRIKWLESVLTAILFLLQLFVGLSFPYEGPAPLEAIANGCTFLNPRFDPPKSSKNTDFFKGKPTLREVLKSSSFIISLRSFYCLPSVISDVHLTFWPQLTSQHPYAEVYIGRPHVWTVNIDDPAEVENAIKAILSQKVHAQVYRLKIISYTFWLS